jgi:soluble lytic murein transglycosylase-like protein
MKNLKRVLQNCRAVESFYAGLSRPQILLFLFLAFAAAPVRAGDTIIALHDAQGHSVYVNNDDQELRNSVKRGGVAEAVRVIDQRRLALPGIDQFIEVASLEQRVDPRLVRAVIQVESAWNVRARSRKGALGLMQLMPETALRFGVRDPLDARENIKGGTRYLRFLLNRFHENLQYSLAGYNAGERAVAAWGNVPPYEETRTYLQRIEMIYAALQQEMVSNATAISRVAQGSHIVYTNLD